MKGPDPKEFEQAFLIDDDEGSTRAGTPQPSEEKQLQDNVETDDAQGTPIALSKASAGPISNPTTAAAELPPDVKIKLRKLERLEPKWQEFLRSYKIAHARVQEIEAFEAALRENTPLTSISDPGSLMEYLNQLKLKSDMVLDEMKRLTGEKDGLKIRLIDAEKQNHKYEVELEKLKPDAEGSQPRSESVVAAAKGGISLDTAQSSTSPQQRTPSIAGFSLFSPKVKPVDQPHDLSKTEEFFSYDTELPRLESELKVKQEEVIILQKEVKTVRGELEVAKESAQSMARSLEESTKGITALKEKSEHATTELSAQKANAAAKVEHLVSQLEVAGRELRLATSDAAANPRRADFEKELDEQKSLLVSANDEISKLRSVMETNDCGLADITKLQDQIKVLVTTTKQLQDDAIKNTRLRKLSDDIVLNSEREMNDKNTKHSILESQLREKSALSETLQAKLNDVEMQLISATRLSIPEPSSITTAASITAGKKKNNKKKKGGKPAIDQPVTQSSVPSGSVPPQTTDSSTAAIATMQEQIDQFLAQLQQKDAAIERLSNKIKDQDELKEEIESLRDDLINVGQGHVTAKDKVKELEAEKKALKLNVSELEMKLAQLKSIHDEHSEGSQQAHKSLADQFDELRLKSANLETDLAVAQKLASSRFKDLTSLSSLLEKAQPELSKLRSENSDLKNIKMELSHRVEELQKIETRQAVTRTELADVRRKLGEKDSEVKALQQKVAQDSSSLQSAETELMKMVRDLHTVELEKNELIQNLERTTTDLAKCKDDLHTARNRIRELEDALNRLQRESNGLREDIQIKTAQHASAESLMHSMRDQTSEMATQTKEARERVESLEEEISDAHRLLNERNREAETMRRLLAEVEGRADIRVREMKERLDTALEERDKAEDDASIASRRRARELEDLRSKLRESQRELKRTEEEKDGLEGLERDWKKRRDDLEQQAGSATKEAEEVRRAMGTLRDALDESEKQVRELEKQKSELRRNIEETQQRLDRAHKSNKVMADEVKSIQARTKPQASQDQSVRSSIDSIRPQLRGLNSPPMKAGSHTPSSSTDTVNGQAAPSKDYLKNVLLQFLEQKDKKHQMQLVPVLGVLLHFDR